MTKVKNPGIFIMMIAFSLAVVPTTRCQPEEYYLCQKWQLYEPQW